MIRVVLVSSILPETNYSAYLAESIQKCCKGEIELLIYTEKDKRNLKVALSNVRLVWDRDWQFVFQIISQALKDKVNLVHLQHEINMYGGARTAVLFPLLVLLLRLFGFRTIVTVHAAIPLPMIDQRLLEVFNWPHPRLLTPLVRIIFPVVYFLIGLFAHKIIVHTQVIRECLNRFYLVKADKIVVIPHGVPDTVETSVADGKGDYLSQIAGKKVILYFGYLHRRKGLDYLLKAFAKLTNDFPDHVLVLAGGAIQSDYFLELQELARRLGVEDAVCFTGFVSLKELRHLMTICEFVVLPAIYSIAASGPLAQVFAHEKPVVVSDLGVYREEVKDRVNGLLSKPADAADLKAKIISLLSDSDLRARLSSNIAQIKKERSWRNIAERTMMVYRTL